jgi:site-specific DNA-methyltransferase (adenine-specific)
VNTESNAAPIPAFPFNQLHQVDALQLAMNLPDESLDMLLTDPPYASGGLHLGQRTKSTSKKYINGSTKTQYADFDGDNMDQRSWSFSCLTWLTQAHRALKPGGIVVCFIDWRQLPTLTDVVQAAGFTWQGLAVWDKTAGRYRPRRGGFAQQAEFIVWATKGGLPQREVYLPGVFQSRLELPKQHATQKPIELARQILRLVPEGGAVADFFTGSGTFLQAAKEAGLDWIGSETNKTIHAQASKRLAHADLLAA